MNLVIDSHKLHRLINANHDVEQSDDLRREGQVFFIGANLPVYSTLETMYESYCQESSELFHVTFGGESNFDHNLEMVRQIKRNFSIRVMGRVGYPLSDAQIEKIYLAGLDVLDIPWATFENEHIDSDNNSRLAIAFKAASATFTRWSVVSSIPVGQGTPETVHSRINELLRSGVIPLLDVRGKKNDWTEEEARKSYTFLSAGWHRHRVPFKPIMPLLRVTTPYALEETAGYLRDIINKLDDRRVLATSDLRRHLRTRGAEASFESAGL